MKVILPVVSIVMTLYNKSQYLEEQIFSIYLQNYTNWELIIVDDCSTDDSFSKAKLFCQKLGITHKCVFLQTPKNLWVAKTFEYGLGFAKGQYIAVCDADDIRMKNKLQENIKFIKDTNSLLVYSDLCEINENNEIIYASHLVKLGKKRAKSTLKSLLRSNHMTGPSIFFSSIFLEQLLVIGFPEKTPQDYWIALFFSIHTPKIYCIQKSLAYYRRSPGSISLDIIPNKLHYLLDVRKQKCITIQHLLKIKGINKEDISFLQKELLINQSLFDYLNNTTTFFYSFMVIVNSNSLPWIYILIKYWRIKFLNKKLS